MTNSVFCRASLAGQQKRATDFASHLSFASAIYGQTPSRNTGQMQSPQLHSTTGLRGYLILCGLFIIKGLFYNQ